jgi:tetratricopeptide (TPR) repeat protein
MGGIGHDAGEKPLKALAQILGQCRIDLAKEGVKAILKGIRKKQSDERKMGCVGLVAPDSFTGQGVIHGRNLDQTPLMKSWAKAPVIYLIKETGRIPYVASGTAGLVYPGGISGFNQAGIAVSLHQMNTTKWDTSHKSGSAEVVPYLQQRILREARSIDEAFEIIKKTNVFSSWTIFISDSKDNDGKMISEVASIEVSAKNKVIARRRTNEPMSQSNHFIDPKMQKDHYHSNLAAYLETQSRLMQMEKLLNEGKGRIDVEWAMGALSSHIDYFEGERSFGRTAVKLSNIMSSIAHPMRGEFWMTVGDKRPAAHSWYVGSRVDFDKMSIDIISMNKSFKMDSRSYLERSYEHAVYAYQAYKAHDNKASIVELLNANSLAALNGVEDTSIIYNLSRLYMMENDPTEAKKYMEKLLARKSEFHPYHQALISMYSARLRQLVGQSGIQVNDLYDEASKIFGEQLKETKKKFDHAAPDLKKKIKLIAAWKKGKDKKVQALDFQVVD